MHNFYKDNNICAYNCRYSALCSLECDCMVWQKWLACCSLLAHVSFQSPLTLSSPHSLVPSLSCSLTLLFPLSLVPSLSCPLTLLFPHSLVPSLSCPLTLVSPLSLVPSLSPSLTHTYFLSVESLSFCSPCLPPSPLPPPPPPSLCQVCYPTQCVCHMLRCTRRSCETYWTVAQLQERLCS